MFGLLTGLKLAGGLAVILAIGLPIYFHFQSYNQLIADNKQLEIDKITLLASNASLEKDLLRKDYDMQSVARENAILIKSTTESQKRITVFETEIKSKVREDRVRKIEEGGKKKLLLRLTNKAAKCELLHFDDYTGVCKIGRWVPNE